MLAHQERKARYRLGHVRDAAPRRPAAAGRVSGAKSVVPAGDQADAFLVPRARRVDDGKIALFLVERAAQRRRRRAATHAGRRAAPPKSTLERAPRHAGRRRTAWPRSSTRSTSASPPLCAEAVGVMDKTGRDHGRVHEHAQAVRRGDRHLPGAAPPHGRHEDAAGAGALDELLRERSSSTRRPTARRRALAQRQVPARRVDALRRPAVRCSCTAASA